MDCFEMCAILRKRSTGAILQEKLSCILSISNNLPFALAILIFLAKLEI